MQYWAGLVEAAQAPNPLSSRDGRLLRPDSPAKIPHIRALLAGGSVRFDSAYSNSPVCAPARSALHSGRDVHKIPHTHNGMAVRGAWNNYEGLDHNYSGGLLHERLAAAGFATNVAGKTDWFVGGHSETCQLTSLSFNVAWPYNISESGGWNEEDLFCASDGPVAPGGSGGAEGSVYRSDWTIMNDTARFAASAPQPFYAFAGTSILHPPYATTQYWYDIAAEQPVPEWLPLDSAVLHPCDLQASMKRGCTPGGNASASADFYSVARRARVRRVYLAELEEFDAMVGLVVAALDAAGRWRDGSTTIVLAADHGDMQLEKQLFYKMVQYDASSRVPLIFASPALAPLGARTVTQPASLIDIFPTLLGLAGAPVPDFADGYDLAPFLAGAERDTARPPFVTLQNHDEDISMSWFAAVNGTHKYVVFGAGGLVPPQLFDLAADPSETANLFNTSDAAREAQASLDAALRSVIDYPAVAQDVAAYQLDQFRYWAANATTDWRKEIQSANVRWQAAFAAHKAEALAAVEAYLAQPAAVIRPCNGALVANI